MKESLGPTFDQAFASLVADLDERGLLGQTLIVANAEFGRTPKINGAAGRDHNVPVKTSVGRMTLDRYEPLLSVPSGGDTSYPGLVWHEGLLWISYYS